MRIIVSCACFCGTERKKDGKEQRSWAIVESRRVWARPVVQRHVLYLGEINDSQRAAWQKSIEVFDEDNGSRASGAVPEDRLPRRTRARSACA